MKNLLVTGGCGFIGSNFINHIYHAFSHVKIVNIDALYYCASIQNINCDIREDKDRYIFLNKILGKISPQNLLTILKDHNIDTVVHFAAQSHVDNSFREPMQYTKDNVLGTHELLEACRLYGNIKKFIHVSTDEVYGESMISSQEQKKTEEMVLCPTNPYAASKAAAELIAQSYYHSYNLPVIITRGNNVYGPNQYPEKLVPKFIKLLQENEKLPIHGDGNNLRSFLHVFDVCEAFETILTKGIVGEIYNIGADDHMEISVIDMARKILRLSGRDEDFFTFVPDRLYNDKRYFISNAKLKALGWNPKISLDDGLKMMIEEQQKRIKVLFFGSKGWIGQKVAEILRERKISFVEANCRADDIDTIQSLIFHQNITHVFSFIGRTHGWDGNEYIPTIDYLERKGKLKENINDNLFCPLNLALICKDLDLHFTYLGTGCIFSDLSFEKTFDEEDKPNFFGSSYSTVKGFTDRLMHHPYLHNQVLNVRIRMPISSDNSPRNFIKKITTYHKVCSIPNSMTVLDELLPILVNFATEKVTGTINLTNPGVISHEEILKMYQEIVDPKFTYTLFSYEEQGKILASQRSNNELDTSRLTKLTKGKVKNIKASVRDVLEKYALQNRNQII